MSDYVILQDTVDGAGEPRRIEIVLVVDIHNEDRIRRLGAQRMVDNGFAGAIEDAQSSDLCELTYELLAAGSADDLSPIDMGFEIVEARSESDDLDQWDCAGTGDDALWHLEMPETTLQGLFSEEHDMLRIVREHGDYWLGQDGVAGQSRFTTLSAAKSAGSLIWKKADDSQERVLLEEAGLDPAIWSIEWHDGLRFVRDDGIVIEADLDGRPGVQKWYAHDDRGEYPNQLNDEPLATIAEAIALLPPIQ